MTTCSFMRTDVLLVSGRRIMRRYMTTCSFMKTDVLVGRCGVVGSTLAFGFIGHGFESEHRIFSHHGASACSKLRSLSKCSLDDSVRQLL